MQWKTLRKDGPFSPSDLIEIQGFNREQPGDGQTKIDQLRIRELHQTTAALCKVLLSLIPVSGKFPSFSMPSELSKTRVDDRGNQTGKAIKSKNALQVGTLGFLERIPSLEIGGGCSSKRRWEFHGEPNPESSFFGD